MAIFKPTWQNTDRYKARKAVSKMTNQSKLERVVRESMDNEVRFEALRRLTDQAILTNIATNTGKSRKWLSPDFRAQAIKKLTDQETLVLLARNDEFSEVRFAALQRIEDQYILADIIKNHYWKTSSDHDINVLTNVVYAQIKDQVLLEDVAKTAKDGWVRFAGAQKLDDGSIAQTVMYELAGTFDTKLCTTAIKQLADQALVQSAYARIANRTKQDSHRNQLQTEATFWADFGVKAVKNITDQNLLDEIALGDATYCVRREAIVRLTNIDTLKRIANSPDKEKYTHDFGFGYRFDLCYAAQNRLEELQGQQET